MAASETLTDHDEPRRQRDLSLPTVAALCGALVLVLVIALNLWAFRSADGSRNFDDPDLDPAFEVRDRLVWVAALLLTSALGLLGAFRPSSRPLTSRRVQLVATVLACSAMALSAAWVDASIGFGPGNVLLALLLAPLLVLALGPRGGIAMPALGLMGGLLLLVFYLPAVIQTPRGVYEPVHASRIFDEVLGPVVGRLPLDDFVPQYGGLLGLPLAPLHGLVAAHIEWWIIGYLTVLSIATLVALCLTAVKMLPSGRGWIAPLLVVPPLLMKPAPPGVVLPSGVQAFYQLIPMRSLLPACLGLLLLHAVSRPGWRGRWLWPGALAGVAAISNFESGAPATLAAVAVVIALRTGLLAVAQFAAAWFGAWLCYLVVVLATGGTLHLGYWVAFSATFAGSFADLPMPIYGNYVLILITLVAGTATAFAACWRRPSSLRVAAAGGLFFGAWGLMCFPFYVARSSSWEQLQFFLVAAAMTAIWLVVLAAGVAHSRTSAWPWLAPPVLLVCALPAAIFLSTVIKAPAPQYEWGRLSGQFGPPTHWSGHSVVSKAQAAAISAIADTAARPVGLMVASGNVASLRTGLPNAAAFAATIEFQVDRFNELQCDALRRGPFNSVIADPTAASLFTCSGFSKAETRDGYMVLNRGTPSS